MHERIGAFNWSATPLGPIASWPPSLQLTVRLMLANRQPMVLWWGPRSIGLYNDACLPVLGNKHPRVLGQPASECWQALWPGLRPGIDTLLLDTLLQGGGSKSEEFPLLVPRDGFHEETHWRIECSPIPGDGAAAGIGGVLATLHDITAQVLNKRRLNALCDLTNLAPAETAEAAAICAAKALESHPHDIPFALLYLPCEAGSGKARLAATTPIPAGQAMSPIQVDCDKTTSPWPLEKARQTMQPQIVRGLAAHFAGNPSGSSSQGPDTATVLPFHLSPTHGTVGFLIAGISPQIPLDEGYRQFLELAGAQVGNALARAWTHEAEAKHIQAMADLDRMHQQAAESLRKQEEELSKAQQVAHVGSWHWHAATDVSTGSQELYRIHGLDPKTQSFPKFKDQDGLFFTHGQWQRLNEAVQKTLSTGIGYELDLQALRGGEPIWITTRGEVVRDAQGQSIGLSGTTQDITERMLAEKALRQSEERVRLLWEAAAVLLTTDDPDTMLRKLFAKIGPHLKLDTYFNFMVNDEGDALKLASCIGIDDEIARGIERLEFGQAVCGTVALWRKPITASFIQQSDDGKVQLVKSFGIRAYACNPLLAGDQLLGTLSFASRARDEFDAEELDFLQTICQYVTAAYERLRLIGKLRETDRRKDEFLASLAHELRNPLAPIRNGLQILRLKGTSAEIADKARKMMERQLTQMVRLIDDLLDLSRISRGKIELRSERVELVKVIQQAVETSRPLIEQAGHELSLDLPTEPIHVEADLTRLAQVFSNLLNNAAKYTDPGGKVQLMVERLEGEVVVSVKDNGLGIPQPMLPRVFEMFTQIDRHLDRAQGGLGIGLSIVRRLVEMHGGSVKAKSDGHGMGSEFIVRLPVVLPVVPQHPHDEQDAAPSTLRRILVVDDNRDAAASLAMMLELMGNDAKTAHDGFEALETIPLFRPDLIFLDIGMPRLNGHETARRIREQPWGKEITLVALTGWGQDEDRRKSEEAGFNSHMVKPIEPSALEKLLTNLPVKKA